MAESSLWKGREGSGEIATTAEASSQTFHAHLGHNYASSVSLSASSSPMMSGECVTSDFHYGANTEYESSIENWHHSGHFATNAGHHHSLSSRSTCSSCESSDSEMPTRYQHQNFVKNFPSRLLTPQPEFLDNGELDYDYEHFPYLVYNQHGENFANEYPGSSQSYYDMDGDYHPGDQQQVAAAVINGPAQTQPNQPDSNYQFEKPTMIYMQQNYTSEPNLSSSSSRRHSPHHPIRANFKRVERGRELIEYRPAHISHNIDRADQFITYAANQQEHVFYPPTARSVPNQRGEESGSYYPIPTNIQQQEQQHYHQHNDQSYFTNVGSAYVPIVRYDPHHTTTSVVRGHSHTDRSSPVSSTFISKNYDPTAELSSCLSDSNNSSNCDTDETSSTTTAVSDSHEESQITTSKRRPASVASRPTAQRSISGPQSPIIASSTKVIGVGTTYAGRIGKRPNGCRPDTIQKLRGFLSRRRIRKAHDEMSSFVYSPPTNI